LSDIHNLATQQEQFYANAGRYASMADTATLRFTPSPGHTGMAIDVSGTPPGTSGWNVVMNIPGGQRCGVFVGAAPRPAGMPGTVADGVAACW
jgi:hypothetical protein